MKLVNMAAARPFSISKWWWHIQRTADRQGLLFTGKVPNMGMCGHITQLPISCIYVITPVQMLPTLSASPMSDCHTTQLQQPAAGVACVLLCIACQFGSVACCDAVVLPRIGLVPGQFLRCANRWGCIALCAFLCTEFRNVLLLIKTPNTPN